MSQPARKGEQKAKQNQAAVVGRASSTVFSTVLMSKQWEGKETQELSLKPLRAQPLSNFICTGARRSREATVAAARQKFSFPVRARHSLDLTWSRGSGRAPQWSLYERSLFCLLCRYAYPEPLLNPELPQ